MRADRRLGANPISSSPAPNGRRHGTLANNKAARTPHARAAKGQPESRETIGRALPAFGFYPLPKTQSPGICCSAG